MILNLRCFFIELIINFRLNKSYYNSNSKKMFNSFYNISDFINKIKYINNSDFYVELIDYLTTIKNKEESVIQKQSCCNKTIMRLIKDISLFKKKEENKDDKREENKDDKREKKKKKKAISSTLHP